jgi:hypothetical protein
MNQEDIMAEEMVQKEHRYEKPAIKRVRLDIKGVTLGVNCWTSTYPAQFGGLDCNTPGGGLCEQPV